MKLPSLSQPQTTTTTKTSTTALLAILALLPVTHCWGTLGHTAVAYLASNLVSPATEIYFQSLLYNTSDSYLANVATWADSYRYTAAGRFSATFHYIDANDEPPERCEVKLERDCGDEGKCIVGAIRNYTSQLLDTTLPFWQRNQAAKFIIHFLGDIHQPLHTESLSRGGNSIPVLFSARPTNLHHVWDTSVPEAYIGGYSRAHAAAWARNLTLSIRAGGYRDGAAEWIKGVDLANPTGTSLAWAQEANRWVCDVVLRGGLEGIEGQDLAVGEYFVNAVQVVDVQVARAGVRLAKWLDLIVDAILAQQREDL